MAAVSVKMAKHQSQNAQNAKMARHWQRPGSVSVSTRHFFFLITIGNKCKLQPPGSLLEDRHWQKASHFKQIEGKSECLAGFLNQENHYIALFIKDVQTDAVIW